SLGGEGGFGTSLCHHPPCSFFVFTLLWPTTPSRLPLGRCGRERCTIHAQGCGESEHRFPRWRPPALFQISNTAKFQVGRVGELLLRQPLALSQFTQPTREKFNLIHRKAIQLFWQKYGNCR